VKGPKGGVVKRVGCTGRGQEEKRKEIGGDRKKLPYKGQEKYRWTGAAEGPQK